MAQSVGLVVCILRADLVHLSRIRSDLLSTAHSPSTGHQLSGNSTVSRFRVCNKCRHFRKIDIGLRFLPKKEVPLPAFDFSGLQLVFEAARRVQILITLCADCLEKLRLLFMWEKPDVTLRFVFFVSFFLLLSLVTNINNYIIVVGKSIEKWTSFIVVCLGFMIVCKMFLMTRMYYRFPKTRLMFDIAHYFYRNTPTESEKLAAVQVPPPVTTLVTVVKKKKHIFARMLRSARKGSTQTEAAL